MSTSTQSPPPGSSNDPSTQPLEQPLPFAPPAAVDRPPNGVAGSNGFNIDHLRDKTGGGRVTNPFCPEWCRDGK
jgi:hypothetical protein